MRYSRIQKTAFSLIELLVVIGIIAMLISILLPALQMTRRAAQRGSCLNRIRQINVGTQMFAADHADRLPWTNWDNGDPAAFDAAGWLYDARVGVGEMDWSVFDGELNYYMQVDEPYLCPLDAALIDSLPGVRRISSYVMNGAVSAYSIRDPFAIFRFPSNGVLYWELDESDQDGSWNDGANQPNELATVRHEGSGTVTRFDGSACSIRREDWLEMLESKPGDLWCNPNARNGVN